MLGLVEMLAREEVRSAGPFTLLPRDSLSLLRRYNATGNDQPPYPPPYSRPPPPPPVYAPPPPANNVHHSILQPRGYGYSLEMEGYGAAPGGLGGGTYRIARRGPGPHHVIHEGVQRPAFSNRSLADFPTLPHANLPAIPPRPATPVWHALQEPVRHAQRANQHNQQQADHLAHLGAVAGGANALERPRWNPGE